MRHFAIALTILCCLAGNALAATDPSPTDLPEFSDSIQVIGDTPLVFPVELGEPITIRFGIGELDIVAADVSEVRAELEVGCKNLSEELCAKYGERLRIDAERGEDGIDVVLRGLSKWKLRKLELEGRVTVPRGSPLSAQIGIGDVEIHGGEKDLHVRMGIGDLTIRVPEDTVGSVAMATRIGDASLSGSEHRAGSRRKLLGAQVSWADGSGDARIEVGLRIGDAKVVLE